MQVHDIIVEVDHHPVATPEDVCNSPNKPNQNKTKKQNKKQKHQHQKPDQTELTNKQLHNYLAANFGKSFKYAKFRILRAGRTVNKIVI